MVAADLLARLFVRALPEPVRAGLVLPLADLGYRPHPYLNWELRPESRRRSGDRVNAQGWRGPVRSVAKPEGTFRVACLGGSTTFSDAIPDEAAYPLQLEGLLRERYPGRALEVLNAGVPGYTTAEQVLSLALKVLDYEPDLIVVYEAINDYLPRSFATYRADYFHFRRVWVEEDLGRTPLLAALEATALFPFLRSSTTDYPRRGELYYWVTDQSAPLLPDGEIAARNTTAAFAGNLAAIVRIAREFGIGVILATQAQNTEADYVRSDPKILRKIEQMNDATRALAAEWGVPLADVARDFPQEGTLKDNVHMTPRGARIQAERILATIEESDALQHPAPPRPRRAGDSAPAPELPRLAFPGSADERAALRDGRALLPRPFILYEPRPTADLPGTLGPHNAFALRGPEIAAAKAPGAVRVAWLGGSSAYGLGVADSESVARRLEAELAPLLPAGCEVLNGAAPGYTTAESIGVLHAKLLPLAPDVVLIAHDLEDIAIRAADRYRTDYAHARRSFRLAADDPPFPASLLTPSCPEGDDPLESGVPPRAQRPADDDWSAGALGAASSPYALWRNLHTLVALTRNRGIQVAFVRAVVAPGAAALEPAAAEWNEVAAEVARETGAAWLDPGPSEAAEFLAGGWLSNAAGAARRAAALAPRVAELARAR